MKFKDLFQFCKKEIKEAFAHAKLQDKVHGLKLLKAPTQNTFGKILIIIPGKTGKAHARNKIRRRIKSIFYEEKLYQKPTNHIILVYKAALRLNFEQLKAFLIKNIQ